LLFTTFVFLPLILFFRFLSSELKIDEEEIRNTIINKMIVKREKTRGEKQEIGSKEYIVD